MGEINHRVIDNSDAKILTSDSSVEYNYESVPDTDNTPIKSINDDEIDHLLRLFHSELDEDLLDVDFQMLQGLLVVAPPSEFYLVSTVLFHKDGGAN